MRVDKVIWKAVLSTLLAIILLLAFMVGALCAFYPSTMMRICYDMGMETASATFAHNAYKRSDDVKYIAYATEVSIETGDFDKIVKYGEKFISDEGFDGYCAQMNQALLENPDILIKYEQYVYGQVYLSMYMEGDKAQAVTKAFAALDGAFPNNNATVAVLIAAMQAGDTATVALIEQKLNEIKDSLPDGDKLYCEEMLALIHKE